MTVDHIFDPIQERTTRKLSFTLKDEDGVVIPGAALTQLTFKLFARPAVGNPTPGIYINSRDGSADLKANVDSNGVFTLELTPADNQVMDATLAKERHVLIFRWKYGGGGTKEGMVVYELPILNQSNVP
jgi:hypothetical protein